MVKISAIIPLYNCGDYIERCIRSIENQGLPETEIEIVVVNDGSTDNGGQVVLNLCKEFSNIRLYNQENKGVSEARNVGLRYAKGEYVHFIDADDFLYPGAWSWIFKNNLLTGVNLLKFSCSRTSLLEDDSLSYFDQIEPNLIYSGELKKYFNQNGFFPGVWTTIFERSFLVDNNIYFENFSYREDTLFVIKYALIPNLKINVITNKLYVYYQRINSVSNQVSPRKLHKKIQDYSGIIKEISKIASTNIIYSESYEKEIISLKSSVFLSIFTQKHLSFRQIKNLIETSFNNYIFPLPKQIKNHIIKNLLIDHPSLFFIIYKIYHLIY